MTPPATPRPGPEIADHILLRRVGEGSYGEVWLARNVLGTFRAVKVVYRRSFSEDHPYEREFAGIQNFEPISRSCEGLVQILQIGRNAAAGYFYYVMELADDASGGSDETGKSEDETGPRESLSAAHKPIGNRQSPVGNPESYIPMTLGKVRLQRGRLPVAECLELGLGLTKALGHLHAHGLLHRDIKPSNIIFVNGVPKLADIGLVTETAKARSFVGTEGFIPPEGPNSPQADIYSLGKVLYEVTMGKDRQDFPEPCTGLWEEPDAEPLVELNAVILKACDNDRCERYQTADDMYADLAMVKSGKSVRRLHSLRRRLSLLAKFGVAAAALALVAFGANSWLEYRVNQLQTRPVLGKGRLAGRIPERDPRATASHIDLADYYNILLTGHWFGPEGNDLSAVPRGLHNFAGIDFDLRGVIQLGSFEVRAGAGSLLPDEVPGIKIGLKCARLHFLQGTISGAGEDQPIGRYLVKYADGETEVIPILYGVDVRDSWNWSEGPQATRNAVVAWTGQNAATHARGYKLQLYRRSWENPRPATRITALSFLSSQTHSAPFLLAITADVLPSTTADRRTDFSKLLQAQPGIYERIQPGLTFGRSEFRSLRLNTHHQAAGGWNFDAFRFTTPSEPGWDLIWAFLLPQDSHSQGWSIVPLAGHMRVGFEDWYHGPAKLYQGLPGSTEPLISLQFLAGKKLRPNTEYLIYFLFNGDQPEELRIALSFAAPGKASASRVESLEAALGLARSDSVVAPGVMPATTNGVAGLHRHFCLGIYPTEFTQLTGAE